MTDIDSIPDTPRVALIARDDALRASIHMFLSVSGVAVSKHRTVQSFRSLDHGASQCVIADIDPDPRQARETRKALLDLCGTIPVIVLSASPDDLEPSAPDQPKYRVIRKPFAGANLLDAVRSLTGAEPASGTGAMPERASRPAPY